MCTMPVPSSSLTSSHSMTRCASLASACAGRWSNGPMYRHPTRCSPLTFSRIWRVPERTLTRLAPSQRIWVLPSSDVLRTFTYSFFLFTAAATFAASVQGVVVHTSNASPSRSISGSFRKNPGWTISTYPSVTISCCDMPVPHLGHHGITSFPLYSHPWSWHFFRNAHIP